MTEQEAIKEFKDRLAMQDYRESIPEYYEAMEMAVVALNNQKHMCDIDKLYLEKCQEVNELKAELEQMAAVKEIMLRTASAAVCGIKLCKVKRMSMNNRDKCKKALHEYVDSLDDQGIYEFISEQSLHGADIYDCSDCEAEHGNDRCNDAGICKKRFLTWITK